jgi:hypothetical protein
MEVVQSSHFDAADLAVMAVKCNEKTVVMPDLIRHPVI